MKKEEEDKNIEINIYDNAKIMTIIDRDDLSGLSADEILEKVYKVAEGVFYENGSKKILYFFTHIPDSSIVEAVTNNMLYARKLFVSEEDILKIKKILENAKPGTFHVFNERDGRDFLENKELEAMPFLEKSEGVINNNRFTFGLRAPKETFVYSSSSEFRIKSFLDYINVERDCYVFPNTLVGFDESNLFSISLILYFMYLEGKNIVVITNKEHYERFLSGLFDSSNI